MPDNVPITAGTGTDIATDEISSVHYQRVKLVDGTLDATTAIAAGNGVHGGALRVTVASDSTGQVKLAAADGVDIGNVDVATVPAPLSTTGGGTEAAALRVTLANDSTGLVSVDDNAGSLTVDAPVGTPVFVRLSDGASAITALPVTDNNSALTVDNGGTFAVQATLAAETTKVIGTINVAASQSITANVASAGNAIAYEASESDGETNTRNRLSVEAANHVCNGSTWDRMRGDLAGTWVRPFAGRASLKSGATAAITDTTSTQVIAGTASNYLYITSVSVWNSSAVDTYVKLQDGSGGTTLYNVPSPKGGGAVITFPSPLLVTTLGNGLYAAPNASANATLVSATGYISTV